MEYVFIDQENVALRAIPDHDRIKMLLLFVGEKQKNVSLEIAGSMGRLGPRAKLVRMKGSGKDALDFHIAFYLGRYAETDPKGIFRIVSKDKGFDPLVMHAREAGIDCSRVEALAARIVSETELRGMIDELGPHFREMGGKSRPKKAARMKAYIKHRYREEDAIVDQIFEALADSGLFALEGSKLKYRDGPSAPG